MSCLPGSRGLRFNGLWHSTSIVLTFTSLIILTMVVFYNAPLDHTKSTLQGKAGLRMWLLKVNETGETVVFEDSHSSKRGIGPSVAGRELEDSHNFEPNDIETPPIGRIGLAAAAYKAEERGLIGHHSLKRRIPSEEDEAWEEGGSVRSSGVVGASSQTKRGGSGIHAYGLGVWGWCEWSDKDWMGTAKCTKAAFWTLPKSCVPNWDDIDQVIVNFPYAVRHALSGVSFIILFAPFLVLSFFILLLIAILFPGPYPPWPVPPKSAWPKGITHKQTKVAWILRDWRTQLVYFILMLALLMPTIVTVLIGRNGINAGTQDVAIGGQLRAEPGLGFAMIFVAWVMFMFAQILCLSPEGLAMKRKDRAKWSTK